MIEIKNCPRLKKYNKLCSSCDFIDYILAECLKKREAKRGLNSKSCFLLFKEDRLNHKTMLPFFGY